MEGDNSRTTEAKVIKEGYRENGRVSFLDGEQHDIESLYQQYNDNRPFSKSKIVNKNEEEHPIKIENNNKRGKSGIIKKQYIFKVTKKNTASKSK